MKRVIAGASSEAVTALEKENSLVAYEAAIESFGMTGMPSICGESPRGA